ncbi:MAG: tetratricopeptide repeat protein [Chitinophagales bacterium]|nr:tetratricopeptide repeat protein [Chitinophagales bacterium]MDW8427771.1 tetratricopeptide repeat protein [Chitinophagales bacterium]
MRRIWFSLLLLLSTVVAAQTEFQLAEQYFRNGEFDKAVILYEKLWSKQPSNQVYYQNYVKCLQELKQYNEAERVIKKQLKSYPQELSYHVDLGLLYRLREQEKNAVEQFEEAIQRISPNMQQINRLATRFQSAGLNDYALRTYEQGRKVFHADHSDLFLPELATLYRKQGNVAAAVAAYLDILAFNPSRLEYVQGQLQPLLESESFSRTFQAELYRRIQKYPGNELLSSLLIWYFVQLRQFDAAFEQVKALDRRNREDGNRIMQFARSATEEGAYSIAIQAYRYLIMEKGKSSPYYAEAHAAELETERMRLTVAAAPTREELLRLANRYRQYLEEFGKNNRTLNVLRDYALFQLKFLHQTDTAIALLEEALRIPTSDRKLIGAIKLDLGDCWLIQNEPWEAMILYGQVDKEFKDEPLGEEARYKNARLSFYMGDFEWAQAQLNVLKSSTSELVANDALALSILITDNLGLDTTTQPMKLFARADLLAFQRRYNEALQVLDSLLFLYPQHSLVDDVWMEKGKIYLAQRAYPQAAEAFQRIDEYYSYDLLADDALFRLAEVYELYLQKPQKAMELYKQLLIRYKGSIYTVEARKRYRLLRGDQIN